MNFNDYKYERINLEEIQNKFQNFTARGYGARGR